MAGTPIYKVYTAEGEYIASAKRPEYAAMILAGLGVAGTTIRKDHRKIVFTDMVDADASNSYDTVAEIVYSRC